MLAVVVSMRGIGWGDQRDAEAAEMQKQAPAAAATHKVLRTRT